MERIVQPIFGTEPTEGRVVEPTIGWGTGASPSDSSERDYALVLEWFKIGELVSPPPPSVDDDPMIQEWFKVGELLCEEHAELWASSAESAERDTEWS